MAATAAVISAVVATVGTGASLYNSNQQAQHAKGAAQAQQQTMDAQLKSEQDKNNAALAQKAAVGSTTQSAALAALRASMSANSGAGGSILTSPSGTTPAPTSGKVLLGA